MRVFLSLSAVLLLSACGSVTHESLWNDVSDIPPGWRGTKPAVLPERDITAKDDAAVYNAPMGTVLIEDEVVLYPEPIHISK